MKENLINLEIQKIVTLYKNQKTGVDLLGKPTDLKIKIIEKNFFFLTKYNYKI